VSKLIILCVLAASLAVLAGCKTDQSGSREFIPGKGWVPTQ